MILLFSIGHDHLFAKEMEVYQGSNSPKAADHSTCTIGKFCFNVIALLHAEHVLYLNLAEQHCHQGASG